MVQETEVSIQNTLAGLLAQQLSGFSPELATPSEIKELARMVATEDHLFYATAIRAAAKLLPLKMDEEELVQAHLEHLLWVEHRQALWRSGSIRSADSVGYRLRVEGRENLEATTGHPTVLITPMMLAYEDALWMIHSLSASRDVALYGEGVIKEGAFSQLTEILGLTNVVLVGETPASVIVILRVLRRGGFFLTYPDFVYRGHKVQHTHFFGMKWPISSSFIALCARPGNMLLPCHFRREENDLTIEFAPPVQVPAREEGAVDRRWLKHLMAATVARLLEEMILANPAQWLLLLTLVAKAEQRAE
jgi:lauroyl/myristoyl acyltransferase